MADITIPREALEAAKREYINCEDDDNCIEAACLAMLRNWPSAVFAIEANNAPCIFLPLTENSNDKG